MNRTAESAFLPLAEQLSRRVPQIPVTWLLIVVNVLVFGAMLVFGAGLWHTPNNIQLAWGANFGPATKDGEWWRLGSALFLHFGLLHLSMNMAALWDGGRLVERMYGHTRYCAIYFTSGLTGNLLSLIAQGDRAVAGGASGAIFGVYGALLAYLWVGRRQLHPTEFRWLFWGAAMFSAVTIVLGFIIPGIDNAAHIGGFGAGTLAGFALARPIGSSDPARYRRLLPAITLALAVVALIANIPAPRYRWSEEKKARGVISAFIEQDRQISAKWDAILQQGRTEGASFDQVAGRIESEVTQKYDETFAQLSAQTVSPSLPSGPTLEILRHYAQLRRDASQQLVEGLRTRDEHKVLDAIESARQAPESAGKNVTPAHPPSQ